jgi:hypothetical protein
MDYPGKGRVPSTRQLALLAVSLTAWDDEAEGPIGYEEALAALADPDIRTASVRGWDAARQAAAESAHLLRTPGGLRGLPRRRGAPGGRPGRR